MMDLIEQFAIDCAGQLEWDFPKPPASFTFDRDELKLFIQLIVNECVLQTKEVVVPWAADAIENKIKEHFGFDK